MRMRIANRELRNSEYAIDCATVRAHDSAMKNPLEKRTKIFALEVIKFVSMLRFGRPNEVIGRQLLKSGTSIGANYREAARAESHDDFIHKIGICAKESAETQYWLELLFEGQLAGFEGSKKLHQEASELLAIFVASGRTAKRSKQR